MYPNLISASKLRNYVIGNSLEDWIQMYHRNSYTGLLKPNHPLNRINEPLQILNKLIPSNPDLIKVKDYVLSTVDLPSHVPKIKGPNNNSDTFVGMLKEQGTKFEQEIIAKLREKFPNQVHTVCNSMENFDHNLKIYEAHTKKLIKDNVPIIYQGVLINHQNNTYGIIDLLIRTDYVNQICKIDTQMVGSYQVFEIKNLNVKNPNSNMDYYKCQLYVYLMALREFIVTDSKTYILGKGMGIKIIDYETTDKSTIQLTSNAIDWIIRLRSEGMTWGLLPYPSVRELYPNLSEQTKYGGFFRSYAHLIGDVTLVWMCGPVRRTRMLDLGIKSIRDPNLNSQVLGIKGKTAIAVDAILRINRQEEIKLDIGHNINPYEFAKSTDLILSVDFETLSNVIDSRALGTDHPYMIGLSYKCRTDSKISYVSFVAKDLTQDSIREIFDDFVAFVAKISEGKNVCLFHWSNFEPRVYEKWCKNGPKLNWIDLYKAFTEIPIVVKGAYGFGLKEIATQLYKMEFIQSTWDRSNPCANGADSMVIASKAYDKNNSIVRDLMGNLLSYNEVDCKVVVEIVDILLKNWN